MHCCVPEFVVEEDDSIFPSSGVLKIPDSTTEDFVELLWQKGPVFGRRYPNSESAVLPSRPDPSTFGLTSYSAATPVAETGLFMEEDKMASWLDYPLGDDDSGGDYLPVKTSAALDGVFHVPKAERRGKVGARAASGRPPLPPETQGKLALFPPTREAARESTVVGSSLTPGLLARGRTPESRFSPGGGSGGTGSVEHGLTSSSGVMCEGEGAAKARPDDRKRKAREGDDSDSHSEDAEFECSDKKEDAKRSTSKRGSRAAEVHNRSERRRRDRINEKMKALQQLIPRCNKSDKASMLDDAIEYLKSLQMQVQMMSMCCNMFPMMFPGTQQCMPPMGMGIPMGMSMGMGLGMETEMSAGALNHPMMPFLPVMSSSHMAPTGAASLSQRLPMHPFHAQAFALSDQMKLHATTSQTDPASNLACPAASSSAQIPSNTDPVHQYPGFHLAQGYLQNQAITEQGTSKGVNMPEKSKTG